MESIRKSNTEEEMMELLDLVTFNNINYPLFPCFLYFYNLIHDKTHSLKNLLIRIMLLGSALLFSYQSGGNKIDVNFLILSIPLLLFIALCLIKKYPLNNRYTKHIVWIYLFFFFGFILSYAQIAHILEERIIGYILLLPSILIIGLIIYWMINHLIYLKSCLSKHDALCLFWCFNWMLIMAIEFFRPFDEGTRIGSYYMSLINVIALGIIIFLYHSFYFIRLIFFKKKNEKNKNLST